MSGCASLPSNFRDISDASSIGQSAQPPHETALGDPKNQSLQIALETAKLAEQRGMDPEAIAAYEKVRKLDSKQPGVAHSLAVLYDRQAMTDSAQREYAAAMAESPDNVDVLCDYGYFLYSTGKMDKAETTLRQAIAVDANHRQASINLASVLAARGEYDEAHQLFEQAIGPAAALHNVGMFKLRHGETASGQDMIAAALRQDPSLDPARAVLESVPASVAKNHIASQAKEFQR